MINKLLWILIIVAASFIGWKISNYADKISLEKDTKKTTAQVVPEQLAGLPRQLEPGLQTAQKAGATGLRNWLRQYGQLVQDPRKAWIELDYAVLLSRNDPKEAQRVFAQVQNRTPTNSLIYPRIKQLERTYQ